MTRAWAAVQALVGLGMLSTLWWFVTGAVWIMGLAAMAGVLAIGAALVPRVRTPMAWSAAVLFAPLHIFIGLSNAAAGDFYVPVHGATVTLAVAQVALLAWLPRAYPFKPA